MFSANAASQNAIDPYFKYVALLMHGDGANAATNTFVDSSTSNITLSKTGTVRQGSFHPYGSNWSVALPLSSGSTANYLSVPTSTSWEFGTGNFTIEAWVLLTGNTATNAIVVHRKSDGTEAGSWGLYISTSTNILYWADALRSGSDVALSSAISLGVWHHIAVARSGTSFKAFVDGAETYSGTNSYDYTNANSRPLLIGLWGTSGGVWPSGTLTANTDGCISNLRINKGNALYTAAFTPSTAPLTAVSGTVLLTCQSNQFKDASTGVNVVTAYNTARVVRRSPFTPVLAYSPSQGGSATFTGTYGSYVSGTNATAFDVTGAFCFECWLYPFTWNSGKGAGQGGPPIIANGLSSGFQVGSDEGSARWGIAAAQLIWDLTTTTAPTKYMWNHIVVCRNSSNNAAIFLNGVRVAYTASLTRHYLSGAFTIGGASAGTYNGVDGPLSDMRMVKGSTPYDPTASTLTMPTAPLTAITNTTFLESFTNAAIYDASTTNNYDVVGNAQISTSIKKYGTGSLKFDGTGDYILTVIEPLLSFGTADFTLETWFYIAGNSSLDGSSIRAAALLCSYPANGTINTYSLYINGDASTTGTGLTFRNFVNSTTYDITYTATISQTTWHHVAVCRSGTTTKLYFNGNEVASGTLGNQYISAASNATKIGAVEYFNYADELNGYIDELRVTPGVARYTANFTPPPRAFPNK